MLEISIKKMVKWDDKKLWEIFFKVINHYKKEFDVDIKKSGYITKGCDDGLYHRFTDGFTLTLVYGNVNVYLIIETTSEDIYSIKEKIDYLSKICDCDVIY